jgi:hypothetical protein
LVEGDSLERVGLENSTEDGVEFIGKRKDRLKEVRIAKVSRVCLVARISSLPWVTSASEVDKNYTK